MIIVIKAGMSQYVFKVFVSFEGICDCFDVNSGICPPPLHAMSFTTAAVDNIDHNPGSTTSFDSFHGTGISLVQHGVNQQEGSIHSLSLTEVDGHSKTLQSLPQSYTDISPVHTLHKDIVAPDLKLSCMHHFAFSDDMLKLQDSWLDTVNTAVSDDTDEHDGNYSWAAHHAARQPLCPTNLCDVSVLLPLFQDQAHSPAMICHAMKIVASAVTCVNPGQIPVLTFDQPLYSLGKLIQWNWPQKFGENHFVLVLGGLHIEMAIMKTIGDWLDGSGWTTALANAHVTSAGRSESMLHASHVARTRHAHEVTAASLYVLQKRAYADYVSRQHDQVSVLTFENWCKGQCQKHPQFQYWHTTLQLELGLLMFVCAVRQSDFDLYIEALTYILPWFFALNHQNYARWVSVHLRDMTTLGTVHPDIHREFQGGKFTVNKSNRPFSAIALDQAHEQLNALVKGVGGAVGLTEKPDALLRWMAAGPQMARAVNEFEEASHILHDAYMPRHHE